MSTPPLLRITLALATALLFVSSSFAASRAEIDIRTDAALERFATQVPGAPTFLERAAGVLIFPNILKAGMVVGGEYGEGALRIDGQNVAYYSTTSASVGFQLGAQSKTLILLFLDQEALERFRTSDGWEAGVDGSVAVAQWGAGETISSVTRDAPIVAFVLDNKGLMLNLTLEGSKFTPLER